MRSALRFDECSDVELIRVAAGDDVQEARQAFAELVDRHLSYLMGKATQLCGRYVGEDLVQEALLRAWKSRRGYRGDASPRTWLTSILRTLAVDARRRRPFEQLPSVPLERLPEPSEVTDALRDFEDTFAVDQALAGLDADQAELIWRRDLEGQSWNEIAREMQLGSAYFAKQQHKQAIKQFEDRFLAPSDLGGTRSHE